MQILNSATLLTDFVFAILISSKFSKNGPANDDKTTESHVPKRGAHEHCAVVKFCKKESKKKKNTSQLYSSYQ